MIFVAEEGFLWGRGGNEEGFVFLLTALLMEGGLGECMGRDR